MSRLWPVTDGCTDPFKDGFKNELDQNGYDLNFVYSAGETGLNWKSLPSKFLASQRKKNQRQVIKLERVPILLCANATGTPH